MIATTENSVDDERTIFNINHIDGDTATDVAFHIAATEGRSDGAALQIEGDITSDVGTIGSNTLRAAIDIVESTALDGEADIADDVGLVATAIDGAKHTAAAFNRGFDGNGMPVRAEVNGVTATVKLCNLLVTGVVKLIIFRHIVRTINIGNDRTRDDTLLVTAAIQVIDDTRRHGQGGAAIADVGCAHFTVAAAEDIVETAALDDGTHACGRRGVTAREHPADSVQTVMDIDQGLLG